MIQITANNPGNDESPHQAGLCQLIRMMGHRLRPVKYLYRAGPTVLWVATVMTSLTR